MTLQEAKTRFMERTVVRDDHWLWQGARNKRTRHGFITINGKTLYIHRYIFCLANNLNYKDDFLACHIMECNIPFCWNPDHIYKGDYSTNMKDQVDSGTHPEIRKTHCPQGHEYKVHGKRLPNGKRKCMFCARLRDKNRIRVTRNGIRITIPGTRKL
jgi:hypothetical protein